MIEKERRTGEVFSAYLSDFGLDRSELVGKRILDLGAGSRKFAKDCMVEGIGDVWSVAESGTDWREISRMIEMGKKRGIESEELADWERVDDRSVVADMRDLPFADGSFSLVLSRDAITHVFSDEAQMEEAFSEVIRVLTKGGEARFFPGWLDNWTEEEKWRVASCLVKYGEKKGVFIEVRKIVRKWCGIIDVSGMMIVLHKF